jgi:hypothetical protein
MVTLYPFPELNTTFLEKATGLPPYIKLEKIRVASIKLNVCDHPTLERTLMT